MAHPSTNRRLTIHRSWRETRPDAYLEPEFASVLLSSIALTRQPQAIETLLELVATESS